MQYPLLMQCISFAVDVCPKLPALQNMTYNTSNGVYGDVVEALCNQGYSYGNGSTVEYIQCGDRGIWDKAPRHCTGKVDINLETYRWFSARLQ